jgi:hypothetical protein
MDPQTDIYLSDYFLDYFLLHPKHNVQGIGGATLTSSNKLFLHLRAILKLCWDMVSPAQFGLEYGVPTSAPSIGDLHLRVTKVQAS